MGLRVATMAGWRNAASLWRGALAVVASLPAAGARLRAALLAGLLASLAVVASALAATDAQPVVRVLHSAFVSAEKFERLRAFAQREGIQLEHLDVEQAGKDAVQAAIDAAALVVLDGPRPNDRAMLQQRVQPLRLPPGTAVVTVGGGRPAWENVAPPYGAALAALYAAGGAENFGRFFALAKAVHAGLAPPAHLLAPPERLPGTGFYHPEAPHVFTQAQDYLAWHRSRAGAGTGTVAFLIHQGVVADMLTREVDALVARSEAAGLVPMVFWFDATAEGGLAQVLRSASVDVLVNLTHMQDGEARRRDFLALDVPVIQTLRFGEGEASDWPDAPSGIAPRTTAVFLAGPEGWGISDPLVLSARTAGREDLLPGQADALIAKLRSLVELRRTPAAGKKLALMFWNYPAGEKNLGASNLNVPRSLVSIQAALARAGYQVGEPVDESQAIAAGQRMLGALYGSVPLDTLLAEGMAARYPLADYERWLQRLPARRQAELRQLGSPAEHPAVREVDGERAFIIPRWQLGNLEIMPQMPRRFGNGGHYHDTASAPDHLYMAAYLYVQERHRAHALVHLGTHGSQEWLPGKDRGLAASDYPWLAAGSLPVFYPYIQDNVGEAIQAKRRGRAVTISHQTPPFAPAGLYDQMRDVHHLIHEYQQLDEGPVREQVAARIRETAVAAHLHEDIGWSAQQAAQDFTGFLQALHDQLHELARRATPLGLHTFGEPAPAEHRASTIMQQLGEPFYAALGVDREELFVADHADLHKNPAYRAVRHMLEQSSDAHSGSGAPGDGSGASSDGGGNSGRQALPDAAQSFAGRARELDAGLRDTQELDALLRGLAGGFVPPGSGGDPIRNPDVASGRNLYAFEADKIPSAAAYESAATAYAQLAEAFRREHDGAWPQKLAFSLWASEAIRHLGVTEAQVLHALGLRPVWDAGGRVTALEIIPAGELGRPRTDVVVQVTGVYRDQFDNFLRLLDEALQRLADLDEPGNPIAANNRRVAAALQAAGLSGPDAAAAARHRLFGNAPGEYGTGVPGLALRSTEWDDDAALARQFLASSGHAYGRHGWGQASAHANLLAAQLRGTQAVIMSRSSNLHGVLSTDHPFEFMGGLSSAVRHLDGQAPQLLISDLRGPQARTTGLARFLGEELRTRYLNPQWIAAMQAQGYAGTLEVLNATNNLFGWQATDASTVRGDQWQALFDTYVTDTRGLGTREWFEQHNPTAQAQVLERMAEAIRKGYWNASAQTRRELAQRWQELAQRFEVETGAEVTRQYIANMAQGFGLESGPAPASDAAPAKGAAEMPPQAAEAPSQAAEAPRQAQAAERPTQSVQGQVLEPVQPPPEPEPVPQRWALAGMLLLVVAGGLWQARRT